MPPSEPGFANGFDFEAGVTAPFRMQPGLRRLAAGTRQLTPLRPGSPAQREKLAVLGAYAPEALLEGPGTDPGPALDAVCRHAAAEHPDHWVWDGRRAAALRLGVAVADGTVEDMARGVFGHGDEIGRCLRALPPRWRLPGLLALTFLEDLALVDGRSGHVPWMAVALPSHWAPADKVGRHFSAIHEPVADKRLLIGAADSLMRLVCGPERWERQVWTVTDHPRLHAHPARVAPDRWGPEPPAAIPAGAWWRTERQTFLPVPGRDEAVFTIAVDVQPLARAIASVARARALHAALASMSEPVLHYRGLTAVREPLLRWLEGVAGDSPTTASTP